MKHDRAQPSAVSGWWANPQSPGAIGVLQLSGEAEAIEHCLQGIAHTVPAVGQARVAWFGEASDIDEGVVARPTATAALLMPHGGPRIRQLLSEAAASAGVSITNLPDTISAWPEAKTELESRMLDMLAKTESPRAVALLLAQPARFAAARTAGLVFDEQDHQRAEQLRALLHPPRLAIVGAPNVGKSTLLNRLAGRAVAITADVAGTTRDAVSARVLLDGLAVDLFDLPGERDDAGELEAQAIELSRPILREADLVLALVDPDSPEPPLLARRVDLVVANKSDLRTASEHLAISATTGQGIEALATTLRAMLVPDDALENERPWLFHQSIVASESDD